MTAIVRAEESGSGSTTSRSTLTHLKPGGVYICEDIHGIQNPVIEFASSLVNELNRLAMKPDSLLEADVSPFQASIHSVHFYPFVLVIESRSTELSPLTSSRHGTEWQPFYEEFPVT